MASQYIPPPAQDAAATAPAASSSSSLRPPASTASSGTAPSASAATAAASRNDRFDSSDAALAADVIETPKDKLVRKLKEQPLVPLGSLLTCAALVAASNQLRKGNRTEFNRALRWRVAFQGLTVVAAVAGSLYYAQPALRAANPSSASSAQGDSKESAALAGITTSPGRPATVLQLERAQERQAEERAALRRRLREAEDRHNEEQARAEAQAAKLKQEQERDAEDRAQVERYIIGSGKGRPVFGQDARR